MATVKAAGCRSENRRPARFFFRSFPSPISSISKTASTSYDLVNIQELQSLDDLLVLLGQACLQRGNFQSGKDVLSTPQLHDIVSVAFSVKYDGATRSCQGKIGELLSSINLSKGNSP